ncbi:putative apolipoprotein D [Operophtera brumata]|uniref:Putative apolipoprotein D n=1 Tax=Operophtera brumata TaxID=104452 RepID=A0A0L7KZG3_OPEBR|nr:putative apolipoprotein D [Operophtera brumata]
MGDFRRNYARLYLIMFSTIIRAAISTGLGKCPMYPPLPDFDVQRMTGTWYEVERSFYLVEISASCTELDVALDERGFLLFTTNTVNRWTGSPSTTYGLGVPSHSGSSIFRYKLNNRMPYIIGRLLPGAGLYNVLFTDYSHFAIVWSCTSLSLAHAGKHFRYKLNNRMPYIIGRLLPGAGLYNVLFTDYSHFAIVWSCTSLSLAHAG